MHVNIPKEFCEQLATELIALSSYTTRPISIHIECESYGPVLFELSPEDIFDLSKHHQYYQTYQNVDIPSLSYQAGDYVIQFLQEDLKAIFFTVDKVLAGAESVPLIGDMQIYKGVLRKKTQAD